MILFASIFYSQLVSINDGRNKQTKTTTKAHNALLSFKEETCFCVFLFALYTMGKNDFFQL